MLAFANLSNALAETLWFYYESVLHTDPFPSLADFFYLLYYPLMLMGLLRFPSAPLARRERLILWLDLGILMVAGSMVSWYFILAPLSLTVEQNLAGAIAIAYPVGDLLLLAGVAALIQRDVQKVTWRPMSFLAAGVTFTAVADALFAYFETYAIPYSMPYLNLLWEASVLFQVIAVAWLIYETQTPPRKSTLFSPASRHLLKQSLPYLAVGSGVGLFFFAVNVQHYTDLRMWGLLYGILLLMALVMARQHALLQENTSLYRQMKHIAITDSLTEVYNRHFFNEIFPSELERAARYKQPLSILIVDINNFKTFNDTFGHLKGDDILKETARLLRAQLRSADTIARFGGDEFVVILPATDLEVLGRLTPLYIPPSDFCIHPFVAAASRRPAFQPVPKEVAVVIEAPVDVLLDPKARQVEYRLLRGVETRIPFFLVEGHQVWGATAMVLAEFAACLARLGKR